MMNRIWQRLRHPFNAFNRYYATPDPWGMANEYEQARFRQCNEILIDAVGHVPSLIEFASAEGHQTEHLLRIADSVTGVEPSSLAFDRARKRVPQAKFIKGGFDGHYGRFAVATAFEVLYVMPEAEVPAALTALESHGDVVAISRWMNYAEGAWLEKYIPARAQSRPVIHKDYTWQVWWWRVRQTGGDASPA